MNSMEDYEDIVKAANNSSEPILWIKAKTQSGLYKSFTVELGEKKKK